MSHYRRKPLWAIDLESRAQALATEVEQRAKRIRERAERRIERLQKDALKQLVFKMRRVS